MEEGTTKQKFLIKNIRGITWGDRKGHQKDVEQKKGAKKKRRNYTRIDYKDIKENSKLEST